LAEPAFSSHPEKPAILLDAGLPLSADSQPVDLSRLSVDALLVSHPHQDHFGLMATLPPGTPVYIGKLARSLIDATQVFLGKDRYALDFHDFKAWQPFTIGDFTITPYLVDHSAADAYAFLIEAEGKRLFYSGDLRSHGRKGILFENLVKRPIRDIDLLFLEGTMLHRNNDLFPDEKQSKTANLPDNPTAEEHLVPACRPRKTSTASSPPIGPANVPASSSSSTSTPHGCSNNSGKSLKIRPPWTGPR
jgi:mRNA degradation ribonuclease J1/J2